MVYPNRPATLLLDCRDRTPDGPANTKKFYKNNLSVILNNIVSVNQMEIHRAARPVPTG